MHRLSLSYKIIAITLGGLLVIFALIAAASWFNAKHLFDNSKETLTQILEQEGAYTEEIFLETLERKGNSLSSFLAEISALEIISFDHQTLGTYLEDVVKDEDVVYAIFQIDLDNSSIGRHSQLDSPKWDHNHKEGEVVLPLRKKMIAAGAVLEFSKEISYSGEKVGTVIVGISGANLLKLKQSSQTHLTQLQKSFYKEVRIFLKKLNFFFLFIYGVAFILLGSFLYTTVKNLIINKLQLMSQTFRQISKGDLSQKISITSKDEIGDLCTSFNNMTSSLQKVTVSRDNLEESNRILKKTQEELAKSHQEIAASHEFTSKLIEHSPVGIMTIADYQTISDINIAGLKILGYSKEDIIGSNFQDFFLSGKNRCSFNCKDVEMLVQTEQICLGKTGKRIPILMNCIQLNNEHNNEIVLSTFVDISAQKEAEEKLRKTSITDELTQLFNRRGFMSMADKQLKMADRSEDDLFLLYADLDNMKGINDKLGHKAGDQALIEAANVFRNTFRQSDILSRLGGDEFAVLLKAKRGSEDEKTIKKRLEENIQNLNKEQGRKFDLKLSVGIVRFRYRQPVSLEELMSRADALMYECKTKK